MKQLQIEVFNYDELSDDAKLKALENYNENDDYNFNMLQDNLGEYLNQLLEERGIKGDAKLYYSLSYSQGDGVCFVGDFEYKGMAFSVTHDGNYYHSQSVNIEAELIDEDENDGLRNDLIELLNSEAEAEFVEVYKEICDLIEKSGYADIEYQQSEDAFKETCEANEYTFEQNGEMRNF